MQIQPFLYDSIPIGSMVPKSFPLNLPPRIDYVPRKGKL